MTKPQRTANRLTHETSPYLQQHAHNPVDWYPWGEEALQRAKRESKPIFLSIGYSACHWCHVMEQESFEDEATAQLMNQHFVNIKVDREERPDLDHIYMSAVQVMTQHGGWPMSVFLTPDLAPFYGGTYFPSEDRMGMPSFRKILTGVANAWSSRRDDVLKTAGQLSDALAEMNRGFSGETNPKLDSGLVGAAVQAIGQQFDAVHGGLGSAPKFFHTMSLRLCLRVGERKKNRGIRGLVLHTLDRIARGGIYDQLGGGFHRYSTDERWLVPHFEKMLYDNALLAELYLEAFAVTGQVELAQIARETLDYVLREMTSEEGCFFSTQDADSEGVEGKFYVWTRAEIERLLDKDSAGPFCHFFDVTAEGNWEGHSILNQPHALDEEAKTLGVERGWLEDSLAAAKRKLFTARAQRVAPFRDEKILVSWNGMMIESLAKAYQTLGDERYLEAAQKAAAFLTNRLWLPGDSGRKLLRHVYKDGQARLNGYADDYATLINALVSLYESDFDLRWITQATALTETLIDQFWDTVEGGFFLTGRDHEKLLNRPKDNHDGATPSGAAMAVLAVIRMGQLRGQTAWLDLAERALSQVGPLMRQIPSGASQFLLDLDWLREEPCEIVIVGGDSKDDNDAAVRLVRERAPANRVVAFAPAALAGTAAKTIPLFTDRRAIGGKVTLYLCRRFACQTPLVGVEAIEKAWAGA
jgi:uncharacterized protein YyaL (SSP411 family)